MTVVSKANGSPADRFHTKFHVLRQTNWWPKHFRKTDMSSSTLENAPCITTKVKDHYTQGIEIWINSWKIKSTLNRKNKTKSWTPNVWATNPARLAVGWQRMGLVVVWKLMMSHCRKELLWRCGFSWRDGRLTGHPKGNKASVVRCVGPCRKSTDVTGDCRGFGWDRSCCSCSFRWCPF